MSNENETGIERTIYRCKSCEKSLRAAGDRRAIVAKKVEHAYTIIRSGVDRFGNPTTSRRYAVDLVGIPNCDSCGRRMTSSGPIIGSFNAKIPCSERCVSSTGRVCGCSCGGANHGSAH